MESSSSRHSANHSRSSSNRSSGSATGTNRKLFKKNLFNFSTDKEPIGSEFKLPPRIGSTKQSNNSTSPSTETIQEATTAENSTIIKIEEPSVKPQQENPFLLPPDPSLQKQYGSSLLSSFVTTTTYDSEDEGGTFIHEEHFELYHETSGAIRMTLSVLTTLMKTNANNTDPNASLFIHQAVPTLFQLCESLFYLFKSLPSKIPASNPQFLHCLTNGMNMTISFCANYKPTKTISLEEYMKLIHVLSECLDWIVNQMQKTQINLQQLQQQQQNSLYLETALKRIEKKNQELITRVRQTNHQLEREMKEWKEEILLSNQMSNFALLNEFQVQSTKDWVPMMEKYLHQAPLLKSKLKPLFEVNEEQQISRSLFVGSSYQYSTVKAAICAAKSGDCILISEGIYNESIIIDKPIHLIGLSSPDRVVLCNSENCETILVSSDKVLISHLSISQTATHTRSSFESAEEEPMVVYASLRVKGECCIENCIISGGIGSCVHLENATVQLRGNRIFGSKGNGVTIVDDLSQQQVSIVMEENDILHHEKNGICVILQNKQAEVRCNTSIANNRLRENNQNGLYITYSQQQKSEIIVQDNMICKNHHHGIHVKGKNIEENAEATEPIVIITNQIVENMQFGLVVENAFCHVENNEMTKNKKQNIVIDESSKEVGTVEFGNIEDSALLLEEI